MKPMCLFQLPNPSGTTGLKHIGARPRSAFGMSAFTSPHCSTKLTLYLASAQAVVYRHMDSHQVETVIQ